MDIVLRKRQITRRIILMRCQSVLCRLRREHSDINPFYFNVNCVRYKTRRQIDIGQTVGLYSTIVVGTYLYKSKLFSVYQIDWKLRSADYVGRPFCFCSVSYFFYYSFLFLFTATCVSRLLHYFSPNLNEIWHVDSP